MVLIYSLCPNAEGGRVQNHRGIAHVCLEIGSKKLLFGAQMSACGSPPTHYPVQKARGRQRGLVQLLLLQEMQHSRPQIMIWAPKIEHMLCLCLAKVMQWFTEVTGNRTQISHDLCPGLLCFQSTHCTTK